MEILYEYALYASRRQRKIYSIKKYYVLFSLLDIAPLMPLIRTHGTSFNGSFVSLGVIVLLSAFS